MSFKNMREEPPPPGVLVRFNADHELHMGCTAMLGPIGPERYREVVLITPHPERRVYLTHEVDSWEEFGPDMWELFKN